MEETIVTSKGTTTIPNNIRRALGIAPGTVLQWARKKSGALNAMQKHIRTHAGAWTGKFSARELLEKTRP